MVIDTRRVHQLIVILLDNALKYTEAKDLIKIKARREKNNLVIEVADNGRGISAEAKNMFSIVFIGKKNPETAVLVEPVWVCRLLNGLLTPFRAKYRFPIILQREQFSRLYYHN